MIGPSAPNGPPAPIEMAEESGLRNVNRAGMRLWLTSTCSIASGIPCPRIALEPYLAMIPITIAPITGTPMTQGPKLLSAGETLAKENRP